MRRTDLTIQNATRVIITRATNWTQQSRLYSIEIRWDYDKTFAKYVWNNEKYSLPSPVANKVVHVDTKVVARTCAKLGLMFKSRFELKIDEDVYMEVWRKDLRENKAEQARLTIQEAFKNEGFEPFAITSDVPENSVVSNMFDEDVVVETASSDDETLEGFKEVTVIATSDVVVTKKQESLGFLVVEEASDAVECDMFD